MPGLEDAFYDPSGGVIEFSFTAPVRIKKEGLWLSRENEEHRVSLRRVELTQSSDSHSATLDFSGTDLPSGSYSLTLRSAAIRHALTGGSLDANGRRMGSCLDSQLLQVGPTHIFHLFAAM